MNIVTVKHFDAFGDGRAVCLAVLRDGMKRFAVLLDLNTMDVHINEVTGFVLPGQERGISVEEINDDKTWEMVQQFCKEYGITSEANVQAAAQEFKDAAVNSDSDRA